MAKTKREFIIAAFIISCAATVLSIVSMATEEWVKGDLNAIIIGLEEAEVTYGLFGGTLDQKVLTTSKRSKLSVACIFKENVCAYSTELEESKRITEIENILNKKTCLTKKNTKNLVLQISKEILNDSNENNNVEYHNFDDSSVEIDLLSNTNKTDYMRYTFVKRNVKVNYDDKPASSTTKKPENLSPICDPTFLDGGLWLTTTFFLTLSIIMGAMTTTISVLNIAGNPISPWFNIWGLYVWNSLACFFLILTMILWGSQYATIIQNNVGIIYTLNGFYVNVNTSLGFSYWMILAPFFLHIANIIVLYVRQYMIAREPEILEDKIDNADRDGMIFVY